MTIAEVNQKYGSNIPEIVKPEEIGNPERWEREGRARLKEILQREEYGFFPAYDKRNTTFKVEVEEKVPVKPIIRRQVDITVNHKGKSFTFDTYLFLPEGKKNVPVFLYINRHEWIAGSAKRGIMDER
ncbi:MAG: hypothetical protein ACI4QW_03580, partial [Clostridia bacterium]